MALASEYDASTGFLKKFRNSLSDTRASLIHQRLDLDAVSKRSLFSSAHLRRSQNWQVQSSLPV
jgi:hypothetical protein